MKYVPIDEAIVKFKGRSGIYCIRNIRTRKRYIGKANGIGRRIQRHFEIGQQNNIQSWFYRSIAKNGRDSFEAAVIEFAPVECLNDLEQYHIWRMKTLYPNGYNVAEGGDGGNVQAGWTPEQKAKMRIRQKEIAALIHKKRREDPVEREKFRQVGARSMAKLMQDKKFMRNRAQAVSKALGKPVQCIDTITGERRTYPNIQFAAKKEKLSESMVGRSARGVYVADSRFNVWTFL